MLSSGAGIGVASLSIGAVLCAFVFFLSLWYGTKNVRLFDTVCLGGALIAISSYFFLHDALLSIIVVSVTDLVGFLPTLRKAYEEPHTETALTYVLSSLSSVFAILALSTITVTTSLYLFSLIAYPFKIGRNF